MKPPAQRCSSYTTHPLWQCCYPWETQPLRCPPHSLVHSPGVHRDQLAQGYVLDEEPLPHQGHKYPLAAQRQWPGSLLTPQAQHALTQGCNLFCALQVQRYGAKRTHGEQVQRWVADVCMWGCLPQRKPSGRSSPPGHTVQHHPANVFLGPCRDGNRGAWGRLAEGEGSVVLPEFSLTSLVSLLNFRFWMVLLAWRLFSNFIICF